MGVKPFLKRRVGHPAATGAQTPAVEPRSSVATRAVASVASAHPSAAYSADARVSRT
jgi:hypothetical protein